MPVLRCADNFQYGGPLWFLDYHTKYFVLFCVLLKTNIGHDEPFQCEQEPFKDAPSLVHYDLDSKVWSCQETEEKGNE